MIDRNPLHPSDYSRASNRPGLAQPFLFFKRVQQRVIIPFADRPRPAPLTQGYLIFGEFDNDAGHFAELS